MRPLALLLALPLAAQSPMFRGNPAHTGVYAAPQAPLVGRIAWVHEGLTEARYRAIPLTEGLLMYATTPAVEAGRICYSAGPFLLVLDLEGREQRAIQLDAPVLGSPALASGVILAATADGALHALGAEQGRALWRTPIGEPTPLGMLDPWDVLHSSPTVAGGRVFLGTGDGTAGAVDLASGTLLWRRKLGHAVRSSPAVAEDRVFVGCLDGKVHALSAPSGAPLWSADTQEPGIPWRAVQGSCAVAQGRVFVGSRSSFLYAFDAATGKVAWKQSHRGSWVPCTPALRDGIAYVGQSDGDQVQAVDAKGAVLWTQKTRGATFASPALAGDTLYVATNHNYDMAAKGSLSALDAATGKVRWTLDLPASVWASPVVAGNQVLVACADGKLYAVR